MENFYDISDNQGDIDNSVVPGFAVAIKATEGIGYTDPDCDANYQQAKAAGKKLAVYHFARPDGNPNGADEAVWFESQTRGYVGEAVFILDLEVNPNPVWAKAFLDKFYELTQVRPWIYMNKSTAESYDWSSVWGDYALWLASYGADMPQNGYTPSTDVSVNGNWTVAAWQYTSKGRLSGWGAFLDLDVFYGDAAAWDKYAARQVPTVTPPAPVQPPVAPNPTPTPPVVTPPVVETPVTPKPPVVPVLPVVSSVPVYPVKKSNPFKAALMELLKMAIFSTPAALIQVLNNNPDLTIGIGGTILLVLKYVDAYVQANPNINLKGILGF